MMNSSVKTLIICTITLQVNLESVFTKKEKCSKAGYVGCIIKWFNNTKLDVLETLKQFVCTAESQSLLKSPIIQPLREVPDQCLYNFTSFYYWKFEPR